MVENVTGGTPPVEEIDLKQIVGAIWKRRVLILVLSFLLSGAVVAYDVVAFARRPRYEAVVCISGDVSNPDLNGRTIFEVVGMGVSVIDSPGNALMLRMRFAADDAAEAQRLAEAGAEMVLKKVNQRYIPILEALEAELKRVEAEGPSVAAVRVPLLLQIAEIRVCMALKHDMRVSEKKLDFKDLWERWFVAFVLGLLVSSMAAMVRERRLW